MGREINLLKKYPKSKRILMEEKKQNKISKNSKEICCGFLMGAEILVMRI